MTVLVLLNSFYWS